MSGIEWDGQARRQNGLSSPIISPYDRAPQTVTLAPDAVPDVDTTQPARRNMALWCSWCYVADDGGGDIVLYPGISGGVPTLVVAGGVVWIGDGQVSIGYSGTAPTRPVKLIGCTATDAQILVMSKPNVPGNASAPSAGTTDQTSLPTAQSGIPTDTYYATAVAGTSAGSRAGLVQVLPDTGGGGPNDPLAVVCFASTALAAGQGIGIYSTPGGSFDWGGGPLFASERTLDLKAPPATVVVVAT